MARVIVVGAGVAGLTCALRLLEAGHRVDVVARDLPQETTSAVAPALWYPYRALPQERILEWAGASYAEFMGLAHDSATGVSMRTGTEFFTTRQRTPWWADAVPGLDRETSLPEGYVDGWTFVSPVIDMPLYLDWLTARVTERDGTLTRMNLSALPSGADLVVNCSGLGARLLGGDRSVVPVRDQVLHVEQVGLERWAFEREHPTYVVPRAKDIVVGGTEVEGEWSRTPDPQVAEAILERAVALVPELEGARILRHKVGLRPVRPAVRVERIGRVIHCYGHGGAGVTLSWGCAQTVASMASA
ncbi:FAD-dependent oxidoreductase [Nocardioides sp.]|uniref:FAD-dependent oxidoreductase n=1 Tax=Nocardioides sp. TaxID=35761 RepID=UPI003D0978E4